MITTDVIFKYGNTNVTFHTGGKDTMINATEMARPFGNSKKPSYWLHTSQAKEFIKSLSESEILDLADLLKVTYGGDTPGTWMHEDLALEFARWLSRNLGYGAIKRLKSFLDKAQCL